MCATHRRGVLLALFTLVPALSFVSSAAARGKRTETSRYRPLGMEQAAAMPTQSVEFKTAPPGLKFTLNGKEVANANGRRYRTPTGVALEAGRYVARFTVNNLLFQEVFTVVEGKTSTVDLDMENFKGATSIWGGLRIDSKPAGARVIIDDAGEAGVTPLTLLLRSGTHRLRVERTGHRPVIKTIHLKPRKSVRHDIGLKRANGRLQIVTEPPGIRALIDDAEFPANRIAPIGVGKHRMKLVGKGWKPLQGEIEVSEGKVTRIEAILARVIPPEPSAVTLGRLDKQRLPPPNLPPTYDVRRQGTGWQTWLGAGMIAAGAGLTVGGAIVDNSWAKAFMLLGGLGSVGLGAGFVATPLTMPLEHVDESATIKAYNQRAVALWRLRNKEIDVYRVQTVKLMRVPRRKRKAVMEFNQGRGTWVVVNKPTSSWRPPSTVPRRRVSLNMRGAIAEPPSPWLIAATGDKPIAAETAKTPAKSSAQSAASLERALGPPPVTLVPEDAAHNRRRVTYLSAGIGLVAASVATLAAGVIHVALAPGAHDDAEDAYARYGKEQTEAGASSLRAETEDFDQKANAMGTAGIVLLSGAVAAGAAGGLLIWLAPRRIERSPLVPHVDDKKQKDEDFDMSLGFGPTPHGGAAASVAWRF